MPVELSGRKYGHILFNNFVYLSNLYTFILDTYDIQYELLYIKYGPIYHVCVALADILLIISL